MKENINLDIWPQMVMPSFPTLLADSSWEYLSNMRPFSYSKLINQPNQQTA
jgi:hypothetical protein